MADCSEARSRHWGAPAGFRSRLSRRQRPARSGLLRYVHLPASAQPMSGVVAVAPLVGAETGDAVRTLLGLPWPVIGPVGLAIGGPAAQPGTNPAGTGVEGGVGVVLVSLRAV